MARFRTAVLHLHKEPALIRHDPQLHQLLTTLTSQAPPTPIHRPTIDLSPTLRHLRLIPTSSTTPLAPLQKKLAFLLGMAAFLRPSDLHRISLVSASVDNDLILTFSVVAPKERRNHRRIIKPFCVKPHSIPELCPVRAFLAVRDHTTTARRRPADILFVNAKRPHLSVKVTTIASWLRNLIRLATSEQRVSVRSIASSLALRQGIPLDDIVTLGNWISSSTFNNHYRREHLTQVDFTNSVLNPETTTVTLTEIEDQDDSDDPDDFHDAEDFTGISG